MKVWSKIRKRRNIKWIQIKTEFLGWHDGQNGVRIIMMLRRKMMIVMMNV